MGLIDLKEFLSICSIVVQINNKLLQYSLTGSRVCVFARSTFTCGHA